MEDEDEGFERPCSICDELTYTVLWLEGHPPICFCMDHAEKFTRSNLSRRGKIVEAVLKKIYGGS